MFPSRVAPYLHPFAQSVNKPHQVPRGRPKNLDLPFPLALGFIKSVPLNTWLAERLSVSVSLLCSLGVRSSAKYNVMLPGHHGINLNLNLNFNIRKP